MGTTADKLARLNETKVSMKAAINDPALGDKFADYPTAITIGKSAIASAITAKGVQTTANATFAQMVENVKKIDSETNETAKLTIISEDNQRLAYCCYINENNMIEIDESQKVENIIAKKNSLLYAAITSARYKLKVDGNVESQLSLANDCIAIKMTNDATITIYFDGGAGGK